LSGWAPPRRCSWAGRRARPGSRTYHRAFRRRPRQGPTPRLRPRQPPTPTPVEPVVAVHDGQVIDTRYGTVQVRVVITGDVITEVSALTLTDSSDTSVAISARAAPILREEVLAAQSAAVTNVSGATYTSEAYLTSVQSALDAAGFSG